MDDKPTDSPRLKENKDLELRLRDIQEKIRKNREYIQEKTADIERTISQNIALDRDLNNQRHNHLTNRVKKNFDFLLNQIDRKIHINNLKHHNIPNIDHNFEEFDKLMMESKFHLANLQIDLYERRFGLIAGIIIAILLLTLLSTHSQPLSPLAFAFLFLFTIGSRRSYAFLSNIFWSLVFVRLSLLVHLFTFKTFFTHPEQISLQDLKFDILLIVTYQIVINATVITIIWSLISISALKIINYISNSNHFKWLKEIAKSYNITGRKLSIYDPYLISVFVDLYLGTLATIELFFKLNNLNSIATIANKINSTSLPNNIITIGDLLSNQGTEGIAIELITKLETLQTVPLIPVISLWIAFKIYNYTIGRDLSEWSEILSWKSRRDKNNN